MLMTGATLKRGGTDKYVFPPLTLTPGQFWVIGFYQEDFKSLYKKNILTMFL